MSFPRKTIRKRRTQRILPLPNSSISSIDSDSDDFLPLDTKFKSIEQQLADNDGKIRELATSALMNFSTELSPSQVKTIFTEKLLVVLLERLNDPWQQIVINALSAVQTLILFDFEKNKGEFTRIFLEELHLVEILSEMLRKFFVFFSEASVLKSEEEQGKMKKVLYRTIALLTTLCEVMELKHLVIIEKNEICQQILRFLSFPDDKLFMETLNFLHVYAEFHTENSKMLLLNPETFKFLSNFLVTQLNSPIMQLCKTLILGIFYKLEEFMEVSAINFLNEQLINLGETLFTWKFQAEFENLAGICSNLAEKKDEERKDFQKYYEIWKNSCKCLGSYLEVVLNLLESKEEEEEKSFETESVESFTEEKVGGIIPEHAGLKNKFAIEILGKLNFIQRSQERLTMVTEELLKSMEIFENHDYKDIIDDLAELNLLNINCLLNICSFSEFSEQMLLQNVDFFFKIIENYLLLDFRNEIHTESFGESLLNLLKLLKLLLDKIPSNIIPLENLLNFSRKILRTNLEEPILVLLDLISSKFSINSVMNFSDNEILLDFLLESVYSENIIIAAQTLNCLFDVYSDEKYDEIFARKNILNILKEGAPVLEAKVKQAKEKLPKKKVKFLREVRVNLKRFIEYKEEKLRNL